ncbi:MAG: DNA/RNA non-specific endonuclease [Acidobacteriota bacterium]|nr:DNA/RNA non-specific endonuclease [Acidobacteriota bacterium]
MSKNKIYGLTTRQWTALLVVVIGLIIFGCRACYNFIGERMPNNANVVVESNQTNKKPSRPTQNPSSSLTVEQATEIYLRLGNPSGANNSDPNNYLMVKPYYALSYNRSRGTANWVLWRVTQADIGDVDRGNFRPDDSLPPNFPRITPNDYTGSGFDRGHICPSKDRSNTREANDATFLMTNIVPQEPESNQGVWKTLEDYSRDLVEQGNEIYVAAGVSGERGRVKNKVTVPVSMWKIVVVLPSGSDVSDINGNTRIIAVDIPNAKGVRSEDWRKYRTTVRQIEQKTGYNLLSVLPPNVQDSIEMKMDSR